MPARLCSGASRAACGVVGEVRKGCGGGVPCQRDGRHCVAARRLRCWRCACCVYGKSFASGRRAVRQSAVVERRAMLAHTRCRCPVYRGDTDSDPLFHISACRSCKSRMRTFTRCSVEESSFCIWGVARARLSSGRPTLVFRLSAGRTQLKALSVRKHGPRAAHLASQGASYLVVDGWRRSARVSRAAQTRKHGQGHSASALDFGTQGRRPAAAQQAGFSAQWVAVRRVGERVRAGARALACSATAQI